MRQKGKSTSNSIKLSKFGGKSKILDRRKSATSQNKIQNKTIHRHMIVKLLKSKDKKKNLKAVKEILGKTLHTGRNNVNDE